MLAAIVAGLLAGAVDVPLPSPASGPAPAVQAKLARETLPNSATGGMVIIGGMPTQDGELHRAADGLFYVTALVNGTPVRFLVDTGASMVVLTASDAERAGITLEHDRFDGNADTANGQTPMARVTVKEILVGTMRSEALNAAVVREGLSVSLLGQNWLSQLASLTISGDRMILR